MKRFALLLVLLGGCSHMNYTHGVPNLAQVSAGLYRGGQPTAEGWSYLRNVLHVGLVIKLNTEAEGSDSASGIKTLALPMPPSTFWNLWGQPKPSDVFQAVIAMGGLGMQQVVYVHCTHGADRTGLVVGVYRILHDRWPKDRAWDEMVELGFHRTLLGLVDFWHELPFN